MQDVIYLFNLLGKCNAALTQADHVSSALAKIEAADRLYSPENDEDEVNVSLSLAEINALRELAR